MHTATHTTDQLATFHVEASQRRDAAAAERRHRAGRTRHTGRTVAGALTALVVGGTLLAGPATAADGFDTYDGGDKTVQGLVDGWYDPFAPPPTASRVPSNVR